MTNEVARAFGGADTPGCRGATCAMQRRQRAARRSTFALSSFHRAPLGRRCLMVMITVPVGMIVAVIVHRRSPPRRTQDQVLFDDVFRAPLEDAAGTEHFFGRDLELVGAAAHHHDFEAVLAIEVDVHGRAHLLAHVVLQGGELLGELADVMIVNERHRGERAHAILERRAPNFGPRQIAQELGTVASASFGQLVELGDETRLHGNPETARGSLSSWVASLAEPSPGGAAKGRSFVPTNPRELASIDPGEFGSSCPRVIRCAGRERTTSSPRRRKCRRRSIRARRRAEWQHA